ncbi:MAG: N-acetyl-gamma-glutamyl-phosphate reductase [Nitrospirales bacterium]|nr:N-acetyl-gamma-glutamyl-phosphate reductase [Nitrospira sp.]MDR4501947.1 N-acetyl-gamma-glutamyl-phosphate reductase [Nitrospirales bacterium]
MTTHQKKQVAVIGASGYTGGELFRLLQGHPEISISTVVASEKSAGQLLSTIFPHLQGVTSVSLDQLDPKRIADQAEIIFLALPHTQALTPVAEFFERHKLVIDLSADYRLDNPELYAQWYQVSHPYPSLLQNAVYGLPELHRLAIQQARLIAVPGCYPTAAILQLAPLLAHRLIDPSSIIIDAKSGISGAGRSPSLAYHFPEAHESIHAYKIGTHRHTSEIEQELWKISRKSGTSIDDETTTTHAISFTPHLVPLNRGILSTAYATVNLTGQSRTEWLPLYKDYYKGESFIRIFENPHDVTPSHVRGSNFCDLSVSYDPRTRRVISVAAIDNLVKGAAGQAIQSMNIALGLPEHLGLSHCGLFP